MATCANHPQTAAAAYCRTCGKPLCDQCKREVRGVIYCEECLAARVADPAMAGTAVPPIPPHAAATPGSGNPVLAAILGFLFPGVGAMYNGQFAKALVHVGIFILLIKLTDDTNGLFGLGIAAWVFYMSFDAYHTARARQLGMPAPDFLGLNRLFGIKEDPRYASAPAVGGEVATEPVPDASEVGGVPAGAYWLIGLGVFFLLANMDVFNLRLGRYLWEFVVIGVGLYLAFGRWTGTGSRRRGYCPCARCRMRYMTGPAMMITVGVLGLLAATHVLPWHNSWPLFLIVLGAIRLAQMSASTEGHVEYVPPAPGAPMPPPPATTVEPTSTTGGV
jgi:hypothetical protein